MVLFLLFAQSFAVGVNGVPTTTANWAKLLGLPLGRDHRASSFRRINVARVALIRQQWIQPARGGLITLLDPATRHPYRPETEHDNLSRRLRRGEFLLAHSSRSARTHPEHWELKPVAVPAELWANGWVTALSGRALVAYLVLLNHRRDNGISTVPKIRTHQYGLNADLWASAVRELERRLLVRTHNLGQSGVVTRIGYEIRDDRPQKPALS